MVLFTPKLLFFALFQKLKPKLPNFLAKRIKPSELGTY